MKYSVRRPPHTSCVNDATYEMDIEVMACSTTEEGPKKKIQFVTGASPFSSGLSVSYQLEAAGYLDLYLVEMNTGFSYELVNDAYYGEAGSYESYYSTVGLPSGVYELIALYEGGAATTTLLKI